MNLDQHYRTYRNSGITIIKGDLNISLQELIFIN
jgi:hypothetical protein